MPRRRVRSQTPDGPALTVVSQLIAAQFKRPTVGKAVIRYHDGREENVHRFGDIIYRIVEHDSGEPKCVFTHFHFCPNASDIANATLILRMVQDNDSDCDFPVHISITHEILILEQDVYPVLIAHGFEPTS